MGSGPEGSGFCMRGVGLLHCGSPSGSVLDYVHDFGAFGLNQCVNVVFALFVNALSVVNPWKGRR